MRSAQLKKNPVINSVESNDYLDSLTKELTLPKKKSAFTVVSLFSGGGGLDLGFTAAGFKPLFTTDLHPQCCETIAYNLPGHLVEAHDMYDLAGSYVLDKVGQFDVVIGGPPCQSFSILGDRKSTEDPRGRLVYEYARFIVETQPKAFLFENVPGLLTVNGGKDWALFIDFLKKETGYHIQWRKLNSAMFGAPQLRERVCIVGFKEPKNFEWPQPIYNHNSKVPSLFLKDPVPAWKALTDVDGLPNQDIRIHGERVSKRYSLIAPGDRDRVDHTDRIHPDKPSGTVLVGSGGGGGRPFIHPYKHRHITVREAARLQSFPDWWVFKNTPTWQYRQVGNAVPVLMAKALATSIKKALES